MTPRERADEIDFEFMSPTLSRAEAAAAIEAAVAEEREACAVVAESALGDDYGVAAAIRARGASKSSIDDLKPPRPDDVDHVAEEFDVTDHTAAAEIEAIRAWDKAAPAMTRDEALRFRAILEDAEAEIPVIPDHLQGSADSAAALRHGRGDIPMRVEVVSAPHPFKGGQWQHVSNGEKVELWTAQEPKQCDPETAVRKTLDFIAGQFKAQVGADPDKYVLVVLEGEFMRETVVGDNRFLDCTFAFRPLLPAPSPDHLK